MTHWYLTGVPYHFKIIYDHGGFLTSEMVSKQNDNRCGFNCSPLNLRKNNFLSYQEKSLQTNSIYYSDSLSKIRQNLNQYILPLVYKINGVKRVY